MWLEHVYGGYDDLFRGGEITCQDVANVMMNIVIADKDQMIRVLRGVKDSERWVSDSDVAKHLDLALRHPRRAQARAGL